MAPKLSFQLKLLFNETVVDNWSNWQYAGADAVEQTTQQKAKLIATKRDNSNGSFSFPASMLTATLMLEGSDGPVPPNLTLQGVHDLKTNDETGSVSSASPEFAAYRGGAFTFAAKKGILTIYPAG
ncbi:MAG TPA: hypothetical protein VN493_25785 [Thermoanaerobaculia bacterium]|nr:hypothetical protein [Thermoanaerobaculia bacterium]